MFNKKLEKTVLFEKDTFFLKIFFNFFLPLAPKFPMHNQRRIKVTVRVSTITVAWFADVSQNDAVAVNSLCYHACSIACFNA